MKRINENLGAALDALTESQPNDSESQQSQAEAGERLRIVTKLFGLFPPRDDAEISLVSYVQETRDIPTHWLRHGCRRVRSESKRVFLPSISELRTACAVEIREHRLRERGLPTYSPHGSAPVDPAKLIAWARRECPGPLLPSGDIPKPLELGP